MQQQQIDLLAVKENIAGVLQKVSGDRADISYMIYDQIINSPGFEPEALQYFYEYAEDIQTAKEEPAEEVYSAADKYQLSSAYGKMIDGALEALLRRNLPCRDFYAELWNFVEHSTILTEKKQKAFALYYIWIDVRTPYFELQPGLKMDNEMYQEIVKKLKPLLRKARFILFTPMEQKTERTSRILQLLDELEDDKERAVLMAQILGMIDRRNMTALEVQRRRDKG